MYKKNQLKFNKKILQDAIKANIDFAIEEDLKNNDKTSNILPKNTIGLAKIQVKQNALLSGSPWVNYCFKKLSRKIKINWHFKEGSKIKKGDIVCTILGNYNQILKGERIAINFLQTLSGTATTSNLMVLKIKKYKTKLFDTRKTIPGLRIAQKYSVQLGGAFNHRFGLYDQVLIKENHIRSVGSIAAVLARTKKNYLLKDIQIEVENLKELNQAIKLGAKNILLDNFSVKDVRKAVQLNKTKVILEASGGIDIKNIIAYAKTKVDRVSIGALTKNIQSIDFSMNIKVK